MNITDEQLMAYADDELDVETRRHVDAAMARDPEIAAAIERHRRMRQRLRTTFDPVLVEKVPDRLLATVNAVPAANSSAAQVVGFATRRRKTLRHWAWPEWGAIAASLIVGVLAGQMSWRSAPGDLFATRDGELVARAELAEVLSNKLANEPATEGIRVALSFRSKKGEYCRAFIATPRAASSTLAGIACHERDEWQMQTLARQRAETANTSTYRQAASALPPSVIATVSDAMEGEPLDVSAENAARAAGWR
jgi:hypothetical protein